MPLQPDDEICYCFHVSLRKIETFCKRQRPQAPSQISECLSAGSGCGWCVPILKKIHRRICGDYNPWWRRTAEQPGAASMVEPGPDRPAPPDGIDAEAYAAARQVYLEKKKAKT